MLKVLFGLSGYHWFTCTVLTATAASLLSLTPVEVVALLDNDDDPNPIWVTAVEDEDEEAPFN